MTKGSDYGLKWPERISLRAIHFSEWMHRKTVPLLRPGVLGVALVGAVYAACQLAKSQDFPNAGFWSGGRKPLNVVLVVAGVITLIGGTLVLWGYNRVLKKRERERDLNDACKGAWHLAVRELNIPHTEMDKLGVNVWTVRGMKGARYLERRATFTLRPRSETRVLWRKGTGAIGTAWALNEAIVANVENLDSLGPTEQIFRRLDRQTRYNLTWQEFRRANHYRAILAIPLETHRDHVAGCLSIDIQLDGYAERLDTLSKLADIGKTRDICERAIG
jgi:hypothetical protein